MILLVSEKAKSSKSTIAELLAEQKDNSLIIDNEDIVKYKKKT